MDRASAHRKVGATLSMHGQNQTIPNKTMKEIKAQLCDLSIKGKFTGDARDKKAEAIVDEANHTSNVGKYKKRLFPPESCGQINPHTMWLTSCYRVYKFWKDHTAPWEDGRRILACGFLDQFSSRISGLIDDADAAMLKFCEWLPEGKELAKAKLNGMYNEADYPQVNDIKAKWSVKWMLFPIPQSHHFIQGIISPALDQARVELEKHNEIALEESKRAVWMEVLGPVMHMAETLSLPGKPKFWDSLVGNVVEVAHRIPAINFGGDTKLDEMRDALLKLTNDVNVEELRNNPLLREEKADEASKIVKAFGQFTRKF